MNKRFCAPCVMLALALVGTSIAFYDAYALYNVQPLWCPPPINGCNEVANSPYARIFDLPVGYYGVGFSIYFMILQVAFIHAFCIYCLASALTTLLLLIAALAHFRTTTPGD